MLSFWYQFIRIALEKEPLHDFCCSYCLFLLYFGHFPYYVTDFSATCSKWLGFNEKHNWPIPCDKRLSKTELTKHVDDSLHWRLVSNCYRRLQRNSVTSISFQQKHTVYFLGTITLSSPIKCFWQAMYSVCFVFISCLMSNVYCRHASDCQASIVQFLMRSWVTSRKPESLTGFDRSEQMGTTEMLHCWHLNWDKCACC